MIEVYPRQPIIKGRSIVFPPRNGLCLWCGKDLSFDMRRISFCCSDHSDLYHNNFDWNQNIRHNIFTRDNYTCIKCGYKKSDYDFIRKMNWGERREYKEKHWGRIKYNIPELEADHIIAIKLGGDVFDMNNLQTLCEVCHKAKTKEDMKKIVLARKRLKGKPLDEYFAK